MSTAGLQARDKQEILPAKSRSQGARKSQPAGAPYDRPPEPDNPDLVDELREVIDDLQATVLDLRKRLDAVQREGSLRRDSARLPLVVILAVVGTAASLFAAWMATGGGNASSAHALVGTWKMSGAPHSRLVFKTDGGVQEITGRKRSHGQYQTEGDKITLRFDRPAAEHLWNVYPLPRRFHVSGDELSLWRWHDSGAKSGGQVYRFIKADDES